MPKKAGIYKRLDGRYCCEVYLPADLPGKRIRKTIYGKTAREVERKRAEFLRQVDRGLDPAARAQTVAAFLADWLETSVRRQCKPRTYDFYQTTVERYIIPRIGSLRLDTLRLHHVQTMLNALLDSGLSTRTVQHDLSSAMRSMWPCVMDR